MIETFGLPALTLMPDAVRPVTLKTAQRMVARYHSLHRAPVGHRFSLGVFAGMEQIGVLVFGRPIARHEDQETTLELTRMFLFPGPQGSGGRALELAEAWIRAHRPEFRRIIAYSQAKDGYSTDYYDAGWEMVKFSKHASDGWTSREDRVGDVGGTKLKYEKILKEAVK